jgi:hypothetical protein
MRHYRADLPLQMLLLLLWLLLLATKSLNIRTIRRVPCPPFSVQQSSLSSVLCSSTIQQHKRP